jgi:radical SAM superfamily enzyme YgiQ (UPF0313 family)
VAGVFEKQGIECRIHRVDHIFEKGGVLRRFDHLSVSAMTMDLVATEKLVRRWRRIHPRGRVVIGGPISAEPALLFERVKPDVVVVGEGEATLEELISRGLFDEEISLSEVPGIAFLDSGEMIQTQSRSFISSEALSEIYTPSTERVIDYPLYQASKVYVEILRGCSNFRRTTLPLPDGRECTDCGNCDSEDPAVRMVCPEEIPPGCGFCSVPGTWGPPRSRTTESIVAEVAELTGLGVHRIVLEAPGFLDYLRGKEPLTDPCRPPANLAAIRRLLGELNAIPEVADGSVHIAIENMKACLFTEAVAKTLVESMVTSSPNIGLETGSDSHMTQIGKCGSSRDVLRAIQIAREYGLRPYVYFIYGLPGETKETTEQSIKMMQKLSEAGAERIILYGFRALPASAFEGFPEPSMEDQNGVRLRRVAKQINRQKKDNYVGRVLRGIAAEPSRTHHGFTMVYPFEEGPLMTVRGGFSVGSVLHVRVTEVLSSGLVEGEVVQR